MFRFSLIGPAAIALVGVLLVDGAQGQLLRRNRDNNSQNDQNRQNNAAADPNAGPQGHAAMAGNKDAMLAACLVLDNQNEIALSQFAAERSQNPEVKQFAQKLIQDHQQMLTKLQQIAAPATASTGGVQTTTSTEFNQGQSPAAAQPPRPDSPASAGVQGPAGAGASAAAGQGGASVGVQGPRGAGAAVGAGQGGVSAGVQGPRGAGAAAGAGPAGAQAGIQSQPQPGTQAQGANATTTQLATTSFHSGSFGPGGEMMAIKRELAQQCLQSHRRELESKQGAEFDKCYIGMQIAAHMHAVDTLTVFRNHATGRLQQTIEEGLPVVQGHLDHAKLLIKQLDGQNQEGRSGQSSSEQPRR